MRNVPLHKIAKHLGIVSDSDVLITGYQIDSRLIGPGELFFCLNGKKADGHDYLEEIAKKGAVAAVVSKNYRGPDFGLTLLGVEDVVASLQELARYFIQENKPIIVGITGSLGKTTTKEFLSTLLEGKFRVGKTWMNYNTKLTFPITLLNRRGDEEVMVVEMGVSELGDMERLIQIAAPDIAIFTKLGMPHVGLFPRGILDIAHEKGKIFSHPNTKKAIFHSSLTQYPEALQSIHGQRISFSMEDRSADYFLSPEFDLDERGVRAFHFDPLYKQPHMLHNFLAAVCAARQLGMAWSEIEVQVPKLRSAKMRFEIFENGGITFINDAYNASPESMKAALAHLPVPKEGGKRIAVLGMMVDMGPTSDEVHREVGSFAQKHVDHLLVIGQKATPIFEAFKESQKPTEQYFDHASIASRLKELMRPGDVVFVKASRTVALEKVFELL
jgi:UDP-N-acetylmuramoyl-tripeptide--D-alanyl-D-alanine ligase